LYLSGSVSGNGTTYIDHYTKTGAYLDQFALGANADAKFITVVPEPASMTIVSAIGLGLIRRRRHSPASPA
jgi:hypothetical protein